jgi:hypothetical protein
MVSRHSLRLINYLTSPNLIQTQILQVSLLLIFRPCHSCRPAVLGGQGSLSLPSWWGDTLPPARGGDVIPPYLRSIAVVYWGLTATRDRWFIHLEGSLTSYLHPRGSCCGSLFAETVALSVGGMDLGRGGDVIRVCLRPGQPHSTAELAQRGTSAKPSRSGYEDMSILSPF